MSSGWVDCVGLFRVVAMFLGCALVYFVAFEFTWWLWLALYCFAGTVAGVAVVV